MSKVLSLFFVLSLALILSGCETPAADETVATEKNYTGTVLSATETNTAADTNNQNTTMETPQTPATSVDQAKTYTAVVKTDAGEMTIALNAKMTPITVNNFVTLARKGFYNGTIFHRVISGFMIQGGDPKGDGTGGPGYSFADEPFTGEYERGTIAMANAGPNTNGSQFFIMHQNYPLPKDYVIFGKVTAGLETVDKIAEAPVTKNNIDEASKPITPVKINSIEIIEQ
jgi:cyclophilin family peptidyl-prolyl cis-trans isomerase